MKYEAGQFHPQTLDTVDSHINKKGDHVSVSEMDPEYARNCVLWLVHNACRFRLVYAAWTDNKAQEEAAVASVSVEEDERWILSTPLGKAFMARAAE